MAQDDFLFFNALAKGERDSLFGLCGNVNCSAPSQILGTGMKNAFSTFGNGNEAFWYAREWPVGNGNGLLEIQF